LDEIAEIIQLDVLSGVKVVQQTDVASGAAQPSGRNKRQSGKEAQSMKKYRSGSEMRRSAFSAFTLDTECSREEFF
jgi:hypothetical protein